MLRAWSFAGPGRPCREMPTWDLDQSNLCTVTRTIRRGLGRKDRGKGCGPHPAKASEKQAALHPSCWCRWGRKVRWGTRVSTLLRSTGPGSLEEREASDSLGFICIAAGVALQDFCLYECVCICRCGIARGTLIPVQAFVPLASFASQEGSLLDK